MKRKSSGGRLDSLLRDKFFLSFCLVLSVLCTITNFDIQPLQPGIDASYYYIYSSILLGNFHSSSIALTYGPLGFLIHAIDIHYTRLLLLGIYLLLGLLLGSLVYVVNKSFVGRQRYVIASLFILLISIQVFEWKLLAAFLLVLFYAYEKRSLRLLLLASVLSVLFLHIKLSLGILAVLSTACVVMLVRLSRRDMLKVLASFVATLVIIGGIIFKLTFRQMAYYFRNGLDISAGYTSAMSLQPSNWLTCLLFIGLAGMFGFGLIFWLLPKKDKPLIVVGLLASFFVWKAAVVRQDPYGHIESLAFFAAFIFFLYFFFIAKVRRVKVNKIQYGAIVIFTAMIFFGVYLNGYTLARFRTAVSYPLTFWKVETCLLGSCKKPDILMLDPELRKNLGNHTTDVYPWEELVIEANSLRWAPRPSPASYGTYTPYLDNLNAKFFASPQAPERLIWDSREGTLSIDGRHIFFDEPATLRSILQNYTLQIYKAPYFILARNDAYSLPGEEVIDSTKTALNKWVEVPESEDIVMAKFGYKATAIQKVSELVLHSDPVFIKVRRKSGLENTYRTVPRNLSQGIVINQLPGNAEELQQVFEKKPINDPVVAYMFVGNSKSVLTVQYTKSKLVR